LVTTGTTSTDLTRFRMTNIYRSGMSIHDAEDRAVVQSRYDGQFDQHLEEKVRLTFTRLCLFGSHNIADVYNLGLDMTLEGRTA
jgi:hypothetical protein